MGYTIHAVAALCAPLPAAAAAMGGRRRCLRLRPRALTAARERGRARAHSTHSVPLGVTRWPVIPGRLRLAGRWVSHSVSPGGVLLFVVECSYLRTPLWAPSPLPPAGRCRRSHSMCGPGWPAFTGGWSVGVGSTGAGIPHFVRCTLLSCRCMLPS